MDNLVAFLGIFGSLPAEMLAIVRDLFSFAELRKGDYFVREGERASEIAFLETGIVRAFYVNRQGKEYNQYLFVAPSIIGAYSSLITGQETRIPQQALTDCVIWRAPFNTIEQLSAGSYELERMRRRIAEHYFLRFESKEVEMALLDAGQRYLLFQQEFPDLEKHIPQYHVASYLGISPTQLSRIKRKFYEEKRGSLHM